jgi:heptosyltransferase III
LEDDLPMTYYSVHFRKVKHAVGVELYYFRNYYKIKIIKKRLGATKKRMIAINLFEHMGDVVASEPIARYIKKEWPDVHIVWMIKRFYRELVESNPFIDDVIVVKCVRECVRLIKTKMFDDVIDMNINKRRCNTCDYNYIRESGNTSITFDNYYNYGNLLSINCQVSGLPIINDEPRVYIKQSIISAVNEMNMPKNYIVIHGKSNDTRRDWEENKWNIFIQLIKNNEEIGVVEVGSSSVLNSNASVNVINLCGKLKILETAEIIRRSRLFLGVDSGPAHLANAVGVSGIILLGRKYKPVSRYLPYSGNYADSSKADLIYSDNLAADIGVEEVYDAVRRRLSCIKDNIHLVSYTAG